MLLAAGNSTRFSKKDNKLLSKFNNKTLLEHNIEFIKKQNFKKLTLVIDKKLKIIDALNNIEIIKGGASRQESVINALTQSKYNSNYVKNAKEVLLNKIKDKELLRKYSYFLLGDKKFSLFFTNILSSLNKFFKLG